MNDLTRRDQSCSWHPYTQHGVDNEPLPVASARGAELQLADGRTLVDAISSWWSILHGHGEPTLIEALTRQAQTLDHVLFAGATHEPAVRLAERLVTATPGDMTRAFFTDCGSTAVEVALKMAYHAKLQAGEGQRTIFVALEGSYHGDTFGAMSVGDPVPFFEPYAPFLFEVRRVKPEPQAIQELMQELGERVAAVIVEPLVQGAAGMWMHGSEFLEAARRACDTHGAFLIADEVMTGFGRTGALFAMQRAGVHPDLMCLAKGLTGGIIPLAATLATESIFEAFLNTERSGFFPHGHTWTANPIGCAVALASLDLNEANRTPELLGQIGARIHAQLQAARQAGTLDGRISDLRHLGGIVAMDLCPPAGEATGYLSNMAPRIRAGAIERGVLLRPLGNVLYALPPACTSEVQCDQIVQAMIELALLD